MIETYINKLMNTNLNDYMYYLAEENYNNYIETFHKNHNNKIGDYEYCCIDNTNISPFTEQVKNTTSIKVGIKLKHLIKDYNIHTYLLNEDLEYSHIDRYLIKGKPRICDLIHYGVKYDILNDKIFNMYYIKSLREKIELLDNHNRDLNKKIELLDNHNRDLNEKIELLDNKNFTIKMMIIFHIIILIVFKYIQ